jgi:mRNA interferase MazF
MSTIQRGEVYEVQPDPSIGREIQKARPCVIVSTNVFNVNAGLSVVCPITEGKNLVPDIIHIAVPRGEAGLTKDSIVLCDQVKAVDQARLMKKMGNLSADPMQKIDKGLKAILGF